MNTQSIINKGKVAAHHAANLAQVTSEINGMLNKSPDLDFTDIAPDMAASLTHSATLAKNAIDEMATTITQLAKPPKAAKTTAPKPKPIKHA